MEQFMSIHSTGLGHDHRGARRKTATSAGFDSDEAFVVTPRRARHLLAIGNTRLYELLNAGELESYRDGGARRITMASIHRYIVRRLEGDWARVVFNQSDDPIVAQ
jgi:excisionase family DNA binding protein